MNGPTFVTYIQQCLAPTLARRDTVILDNLAAHKAGRGIRSIEPGRDILHISSKGGSY
jgi:hypothetical protein